MRNSIKFSLLAFMAILMTGTLFSQKHKKDIDPETRAERMTERMTSSLNLSDAQATKVKALFLKYGERKKAMRTQKKEGDREQMRTAMKQIHTDFEKEMKTILSSEQFEEFQVMPRPDHRRKRGHYRKRGGRAHIALFKEKAKPIMLKQRAKLESKISAEDKVTIAQLRIDLKKERPNRKELKGQQGEKPNKADRENRRVEREKDPNHIKLVELTEKYSAEIEPLLAEVKEEIKALKMEMGRKEKKVEKENEKEKEARVKNLVKGVKTE